MNSYLQANSVDTWWHVAVGLADGAANLEQTIFKSWLQEQKTLSENSESVFLI